MRIKRFSSPPYMTNTYCLYESETSQAILIDPTGSEDPIRSWVESEGLSVIGAVFTHAHADHFPKPSEIWFQEFPWYAHQVAVEGFLDPEINLSASIYGELIAYKQVQALPENNTLAIGPFDLWIIETPGHTQGSVCYQIGNVLFSGDTLFKESVGRCDLPTGSMSALKVSLKNMIATMPDETLVFPGHGDQTTIGYERKVNPYIEVES